MARDDEMIVSFPARDLPDVAEGLRRIKEHGHGLPLGLTMQPEYPLPAAYVKIGKSMGMDWIK